MVRPHGLCALPPKGQAGAAPRSPALTASPLHPAFNNITATRGMTTACKEHANYKGPREAESDNPAARPGTRVQKAPLPAPCHNHPLREQPSG